MEFLVDNRKPNMARTAEIPLKRFLEYLIVRETTEESLAFDSWNKSMYAACAAYSLQKQAVLRGHDKLL